MIAILVCKLHFRWRLVEISFLYKIKLHESFNSGVGMKDCYHDIGMFFSILRLEESLLISKFFKFNIFSVAGVIGFISVVLKECRVYVLSRYDEAAIEACANPTPGSIHPILQAARNLQYYCRLPLLPIVGTCNILTKRYEINVPSNYQVVLMKDGNGVQTVKSVTVQSGYDCDFKNIIGQATGVGSIPIKNGSVVMENITVSIP